MHAHTSLVWSSASGTLVIVINKLVIYDQSLLYQMHFILNVGAVLSIVVYKTEVYFKY
jgi:hypothetical protein